MFDRKFEDFQYLVYKCYDLEDAKISAFRFLVDPVVPERAPTWKSRTAYLTFTLVELGNKLSFKENRQKIPLSKER